MDGQKGVWGMEFSVITGKEWKTGRDTGKRERGGEKGEAEECSITEEKAKKDLGRRWGVSWVSQLLMQFFQQIFENLSGVGHVELHQVHAAPLRLLPRKYREPPVAKSDRSCSRGRVWSSWTLSVAWITLDPWVLDPLSYLGSGRHRDLLLPSPLWPSSVSSCEVFFGCVCLKRGCSLGSTDSPLTRVGLSFTMSIGKTPKPLAPALRLVQSIGPTVKASWTDLQLVVSQAPQTNFIPELNASPPHTHLVLIHWTGGLQSVAHGTKTGTLGKCR